MSRETPTRDRPYFLWDYDMSEEEVRDLVRNGSPAEKAWVIGRILEHANWADIWRYVTVADIRESLPHIRFRRREDGELWAYAVERWTRDG